MSELIADGRAWSQGACVLRKLPTVTLLFWVIKTAAVTLVRLRPPTPLPAPVDRRTGAPQRPDGALVARPAPAAAG